MLRRRKRIVIVTFAIVLATLSLSATFTSENGAEIINSDALSIGDVAVSGEFTEDGQCIFEDITVKTDAIGDGNTKWFSLGLDDNCRLIVDAKWVGDLENGPAEIVNPLLELSKNETDVIEESAWAEGHQGTRFSVFLQSCKTSYQFVYMYGYGGQGDKLTKKWGTLTFCYTGSTATISSQSGSCQGSSIMWWTWVVDGCLTTNVVPGPASVVSRSGRGNYHCSPVAQAPCNGSDPNGYYHNLRDTEYGYASGASTCSYGWEGSIVLGVGRQILQGCN